MDENIDPIALRVVLLHCLPGLPVELVDAIVSTIEFRLTFKRSLPHIVRADWPSNRPPMGWIPDHVDRNTSYLVTPKLPEGVKLVHEVVFQLVAHDQGWCSDSALEGTQNGWTWFEAAIIRGENPVWLDRVAKQGLPTDLWLQVPESDEERRTLTPAEVPSTHRNLKSQTRWHIISNTAASRSMPQTHNVNWTSDDAVEEPSTSMSLTKGILNRSAEFVQLLRAGDRVALFARAKQPMWYNYVESASLDIHYVV